MLKHSLWLSLPPQLSEKEASKISPFQVFPESDIIVYCTRCYLMIQLLILSGCLWSYPETGVAGRHPSHLLPLLCSNNDTNLPMNLMSQLLQLLHKNEHPNHVVLVANTPIKTCPILLIICEIQIKIMMRQYFIPIRMAVIKKVDSNNCQKWFREIGTLIHYWWECEMLYLLWTTVWEFLKILKIQLPYNPTITLLSLCQRNKNTKKNGQEIH